MIKRRSKIRRGVTMIASAAPTIADMAVGIWKNEKGRRWLVPLIVFLCATGLLLILANTVEALAPFIYVIF